ncbi:hypothetical protein BB559_001544 [Furculomyces boomerangus]|uniref:Anti-proliferative protein domain-containing protein n=2 Tax=Harpellales TaxID=61421 RepID=A0A2T9Z1Q8_9FUNG|nr:hypothetical protein BB559_001544 [Furculomyces boomerangus]PVZ99496.1 hypothetical protein BB558_004504 [Smittium angustum]
MQLEVSKLVEFLLNKIPDSSLQADERESFARNLQKELLIKYKSHWHPENSYQGSAYRSISIWGDLDPILLSAANSTTYEYPNTNIIKVLEQCLPQDLILWCDPFFVCYRIGDHGTMYTIYENKKGLIDNAKRSMAERAAKSNSDFVISAYTTPIVMRRASGVNPNGTNGIYNPEDSRSNSTTPFRKKTPNSTKNQPGSASLALTKIKQQQQSTYSSKA